MKSKYRAKLEELIEEFIEDNCENDDFVPDGVYYSDGLADKMVSAAILIFDAEVDAQVFAEEQKIS